MDKEFDERLLELSARDARDNIPLAVVIIIIITLGVFGNIAAFIFYGFKERKTVTNFLIAVLAFNDLVVNLVFYDELFFHFEPFKFTNLIGCKMLYVVNNWVLLNSVSLMLVIAVERYRKICHPFSWQFTRISARVVPACVTIITLILCSREAIFAEIVPEHILMNDNSTVMGYVCVHSHDKHLKPYIKGSNYVTMIFYLSLFTSIITCYSLIIRRILQVNKATKGKNTSQNKTQEVNIEMTETTNSSSNATVSTNASQLSNKDSLIAKDSVKMQGTSSDANEDNAPKHFKLDKKKKMKIKPTDSSAESQQEAMLTKQKKDQPNKLAEVEKKITKMIIIVAVASILSFVPYFLVVLLVPSHYSTENQLSNMKKKVFRESYKFNGVINPYIMCVFSANFREFIKGLICRCFMKKQSYKL